MLNYWEVLAQDFIKAELTEYAVETNFETYKHYLIKSINYDFFDKLYDLLNK